MDLELRHLRLVCAIAEAGSVTKAAASLGLAQPALTTQLQRIERSLGGPLFLRDRRGTRPTALGDLVLARARVLIPAVNGLRHEASELINRRVVSYRLGASNGPVVGGLVRRLGQADQNTHVSVHTTWSENEIVRMVRDGRLDYALIGVCPDGRPEPSDGMAWLSLSYDPVWVLMSVQHPLANRTEVNLAELSGEQWVTSPGDGCFLECFGAACAKEGFAPRPGYELDSGSSFDLVVSGAAVALCQGTVRQVPGAVAMPLAGTPLGWRHVLGWNSAFGTADDAARVAEHARQAYLDVVRQRPRYARWLDRHPDYGVQF